ncbi:hypothetical protein B0I72DRAFT_135859 [Yarrowia lipolytica]|jgi:RNA recognition motif-containing protein|uniref:YALI0D04917p n=2 Tax=Yarrowia lipolytica TaxID=4952 RepID=Q6CA89_YARLI|nr:YALI0D04917p [Yarrowia lipolytica CLIB122]AOW03595.1 hypothetical protein YALI1_D06276g [Yarrowia lipolytica]KAB8284639.1 hypothetical protein BKA91DRAFT_134616 [Yarrowia lipolytica]KAE8170514.1 hypothetical protein BKA90DRAFT_140754 [Yarrowia lipolytica]KAJ8054783.1 hypothetical protein LXG23DRAFT_56338 [Yarrowia lipolytica]QNP97654.1 Protein NAM8 [Yarrowia lipolytica]|eukprot:XP_502423.2 YALI0D04917p [Yarrowia lipolytica CLIB122]
MSTIYMGDLEPWMDEAAIKNMWAQVMGPDTNINVKLIRDKFTDSINYGFIDFASPELAAAALKFNGKPIPGTDRLFKLGEDNGDGAPVEFSIFVGDLAPESTEPELLQAFKSRYESCRAAKIMTDPVTGLSRGYGFVRFSSEEDQQKALQEMQGYMLGSRPLRVSTATPKNRHHHQPYMQFQPQQFQPPAHYQQLHSQHPFPHHPNGAPSHQVHQPFYGGPAHPLNQFTDANNTTVFVGGLSSSVSEDELRQYFQGFGDITYVKIPPGKGCGFVQYVQRQSAEMAITQMQGYPIGNGRVRLSWGRSQSQQQVHHHHQYRPAPQPLIYPQMGIPAQNYGPYQPVSPALAHRHAAPLQTPAIGDQEGMSTNATTLAYAAGLPPVTGAPAAPGEDPSEPIPVARLNELYLAARDGRLDRVESESSGYHGVYAQ